MAAGTPVRPGNTNTYLLAHQKGLIVDFSRNPDSFPLNQYCKVIPVDKEYGAYLRFGIDGGLPEEAARVVSTLMSDTVWNPGSELHDGNDFGEMFQYADYKTERHAMPFIVPYEVGEQAPWNVFDDHARRATANMMTRRTVEAITKITTTGNHLSTHYSAVSSISGVTGKWDVSTVSRQDIRRSIHYACDLINLDTLGVVQQKDLILVMSKGCAQKVARSQEIIDYLKSQEGSPAVIEGKAFDSGNYDMPSMLYGVKVVIEDTVKVTSARGATRAASRVLADATPFIVSRPGGVEGNANSQESASCSLGMFVYNKQELAVEQEDDSWNKRTKGKVVDNRIAQVIAPATAFLFTAAVS